MISRLRGANPPPFGVQKHQPTTQRQSQKVETVAGNCQDCVAVCATLDSAWRPRGAAVQGYSDHKKVSPPRTLQQDYTQDPMMVLGGRAASYERGTPVHSRVSQSASDLRGNHLERYKDCYLKIKAKLCRCLSCVCRMCQQLVWLLEFQDTCRSTRLGSSSIPQVTLESFLTPIRSQACRPKLARMSLTANRGTSHKGEVGVKGGSSAMQSKTAPLVSAVGPCPERKY